MAMEVGADLANMNESWWYPAASIPGEQYEGRPLARFVGVERTAPHSIIVDRFGQRFVNEAANYNDMQKAFFSFDANEYSPRAPAVLGGVRPPVPVAVPGGDGPARAIRTPSGCPSHDTLEGLARPGGHRRRSD